MIVAILIDYKVFNDKSLTMRINEGEGEYVANDVDYVSRVVIKASH